MSEEVKWDCEYCTYKNFPVSKKCVLCHALRPLQVISDLENSEQDIYKVAERDALNNENAACTSNKDAENKWSCTFCTFLNFTTSSTCSQCKGSKKQAALFVGLQKKDLSKPLTIKTQPTSLTKPLKVPQLAQSANSENSKLNLNTAIATFARNTIKWSCKACTYENYPQSKQCIMCRTPRGRIYSDSSESPSSPEPSLEVDTKNQENIRSGQNSPNSIKNQKENEQRKIKSGQNSPVNNRTSQTSSPVNKRSGSRSGNNSPYGLSSGQSSPNNRLSPVTPNNSLHCNQDQIILYGSNSGPSSPNAQSGHTSPRGQRSGQNSPQEHLSGLSSPSGRGQSSPVEARAVGGNRNGNRIRKDMVYINDGDGAIGGWKEEEQERKINKLRKKLSTQDIVWLTACEAVVNGDPAGIERYLTSGGDPARQLTKDELLILDRPSAFELGHTLVHLALRFRRDDMVAVLLTATDIASKGFKRLPSYTCPDLSSDIRREISMMVRQRKCSFPCFFLTDCATFSLPAEIEDLPRHVHDQLMEEILDGDVDKELTEDLIINWSLELSEKLGSRLYALWNRTAGDCLLDSVLQATWGILDIDNTLRKLLADSLREGAMSFYPKWKEYETMQAHLLNFTLDETQCTKDWKLLLTLASQPGASLEQLHIFALAHILRRPIIVYGVKVVKSFRGETIDFARFEGVYLPLLWERTFCWKTPIALGYTRGHFSALVPMEIDTDIPIGAGAHIDNAVDEQINYLPLVDHEGAFLPIHFVTGSELGQDETILRRWLDCFVTQDGLFVAIQKIGKRPPHVKQMMEVWLDHYRHLVNFSDDPTQVDSQQFSSDGDSDQD